MFNNILGKSKTDKELSDLVLMIKKMNLTEKRDYIKNKLTNSPVSRDGIVEVLKELISKDEKTSKRYIEIDDMDVKKKKAFDLVIMISTHNMLTVPAVDLIRKFAEVYSDIIEKFDKDNKQIYTTKLKEAIKNAVLTMSVKSDLENKRQVLKH